jgi:hypothetical protein
MNLNAKRCTVCGMVLRTGEFRWCRCHRGQCEPGKADYLWLTLFTGDNSWAACEWESKAWVGG